MLPETHPVLKALRKLCSGHLPLYEAMVALMQEEFFKDPQLTSAQKDHASVNQFLQELFEEREVIYTKQETAKMLSEHHPDLVTWLFDVKPRGRGKPPKSSNSSKS